MHNILITGANGALAGKLIKRFADLKYSVIASTRNTNNISEKNSDVQYINNNDIINTDILKNVDLIIHCAFPRKSEPEILAEGLNFFASVIAKAKEMNVKSFINISSQDIYGNYREIPSVESSLVKPLNNYALTKYACEIIGCSYAKNSKTKLTNIRLGSLVGKEYPERVINKIIHNALETRKISVNNDKNVFGYLDIDDAAEGIFQFVQNSNSNDWQEIYNFGAKYEEQKNFEFIAKCIQELLQKHYFKIDLEIKKAENADKLCYLNSNEFYRIAKYTPETPLKKSIEKIFMLQFNNGADVTD